MEPPIFGQPSLIPSATDALKVVSVFVDPQPAFVLDIYPPQLGGSFQLKS